MRTKLDRVIIFVLRTSDEDITILQEAIAREHLLRLHVLIIAVDNNDAKDRIVSDFKRLLIGDGPDREGRVATVEVVNVDSNDKAMIHSRTLNGLCSVIKAADTSGKEGAQKKELAHENIEKVK